MKQDTINGRRALPNLDTCHSFHLPLIIVDLCIVHERLLFNDHSTDICVQKPYLTQFTVLNLLQYFLAVLVMYKKNKSPKTTFLEETI